MYLRWTKYKLGGVHHFLEHGSNWVLIFVRHNRQNGFQAHGTIKEALQYQSSPCSAETNQCQSV